MNFPRCLILANVAVVLYFWGCMAARVFPPIGYAISVWIAAFVVAVIVWRRSAKEGL